MCRLYNNDLFKYMKDTPRRRVTVMSSLNEISTDQLRNRMVVWVGCVISSVPAGFCIGIKNDINVFPPYFDIFLMAIIPILPVITCFPAATISKANCLEWCRRTLKGGAMRFIIVFQKLYLSDRVSCLSLLFRAVTVCRTAASGVERAQRAHTQGVSANRGWAGIRAACPHPPHTTVF
jgi:hypothetical protein